MFFVYETYSLLYDWHYTLSGRECGQLHPHMHFAEPHNARDSRPLCGAAKCICGWSCPHFRSDKDYNIYLLIGCENKRSWPLCTAWHGSERSCKLKNNWKTLRFGMLYSFSSRSFQSLHSLVCSGFSEVRFVGCFIILGYTHFFVYRPALRFNGEDSGNIGSVFCVCNTIVACDN